MPEFVGEESKDEERTKQLISSLVNLSLKQVFALTAYLKAQIKYEETYFTENTNATIEEAERIIRAKYTAAFNEVKAFAPIAEMNLLWEKMLILVFPSYRLQKGEEIHNWLEKNVSFYPENERNSKRIKFLYSLSKIQRWVYKYYTSHKKPKQ